MSMREVEPGVNLIMDDSKINEGPAWHARTVTESEETNE
jgi:hypothetical protein